MIEIQYEKYYNDRDIRQCVERFANLEMFADWMFGKMLRDYTKDSYSGMNFPTREQLGKVCGDYAVAIQFTPEEGGMTYYIHKITNDKGQILFTNGRTTAGQRHMSNEIDGFLRNCEIRRKNPKFNFCE